MSEQKRASASRRSRSAKRRKRVIRAWCFRILFALILLLVSVLAILGVKLVIDLISGPGKETKPQPQKPALQQEAMLSEQEKTESESELHEPVITTLTLTATGDCTLGAGQTQDPSINFNAYYSNYGPDYFFQNVRSIFEADDLTLINLECVLTNSTNRVDKTFNLKGKPEYTAIMTGSSVEAVTLGNNHSADYGPESLADTKENVENAGIKWAIGEDVATYTTKDGLVVGIVSQLIVTQTGEREQIMLNGIARLKEMGANLIVVCPHWGIEKEHYPQSEQVSLAHRLIDAGADLIVGNHPHVLQGAEVYKGKVILYSLGNFCFGGNTNPQDKDTMIYQQTFTFADGVLQTDLLDARVIPCRVSGHSDYNDFCPIISTDRKQTILDLVNQYSQSWGSVKFDGNGTLTQP